MAPHSQYTNSFVLLTNLINQPMLHVDSSRECTIKITHYFIQGIFNLTIIFSFYKADFTKLD